MRSKALALCLTAAFWGTACSGSAPASAPASTEVVVFAAASMTETLTQIAGQYSALHPDVELVFNFDSSGTLRTQIMEGAPCDLFLSASPKQMDELAEAGLLQLDSRLDLLENKVTLAAAPGAEAVPAGFDLLAQALADGTVLLAVGNADVPVGQYTQRIFAHYGLDEASLAQSGVLTYGSNVKEVTTQVAEGAVDCGIIYATDAFSAGLTVLDTAAAELCGRVIYPAALTADAPAPEAARAFLDHLTTPDAAAVFEAVGFTPLTR